VSSVSVLTIYIIQIIRLAAKQRPAVDISGCTTVRITGVKFGVSQGDCNLSFGDLEVKIISWPATDIIPIASAHAAGAPDATV
jgi:hypothetical protein